MASVWDGPEKNIMRLPAAVQVWSKRAVNIGYAQRYGFVVGLSLMLAVWRMGLAGEVAVPAKPPTPAKPAPAAAPAPKPDRGFCYIHDEVKDVPWSIHIFKVDRKHKELELDTVSGTGTVLGMGIVSQMVKGVPPEWGKPMAAVNGDFFDSDSVYPGDPDGLQIVHGELMSGPNPARVCFWVDKEGNPRRNQVTGRFTVTWPDKTSTPVGLNEPRGTGAVLYTRAVGPSSRTAGLDVVLENGGSGAWLPLQVGQNYTARVRRVNPAGNSPIDANVLVLSLGAGAARPAKIDTGMVVQVSMATTPDLTGARTAIGGGPTLVVGGKAHQVVSVKGRNPRTAVGWNKDFIYLVEVDGRQRSLSVGMTFAELTAYLVKLGCEEAVNLDGGGSATMWVLGNVMNSPSEGAERPAANALVVLQKTKSPK